MKLSMWMIANRLISLDMELSIREDAPIELNSARRAYATNCVHVYQDGEHVVCSGEGNRILLKNMGVTQAFEIIQGVFDFYEDWLERIISLIRQKNYRETINQSWILFHNPLILLDGNNKVLGMSEQYGADMVDEEWQYLSRYGYSSLNATQHMRYHYASMNFNQNGPMAYDTTGNRLMEYGGLTCEMYCNEVNCGKITLLSRDRQLNRGDEQLLEKLASIFEPGLGYLYYESFLGNSNVFYNILSGLVYDERKLEQQLNYQQWSLTDTYHLALLEVMNPKEEPSISYNLNLLMHTILLQLPGCVVLKKSPYLLVLSNKELSTDSSVIPFFKTLAATSPVRIGFSLPCDGLLQASYLYEQAESAILYGTLCNPDQKLFYFFDFAMDFIIEIPSLIKSVHACHPVIAALFQDKVYQQDEMFDTLKIYLDRECSVAKTAASLGIHRNTILYRINKIKDLLKDSLEQPYIRDYIALSMRVLELYHKKEAVSRIRLQ